MRQQPPRQSENSNLGSDLLVLLPESMITEAKKKMCDELITSKDYHSFYKQINRQISAVNQIVMIRNLVQQTCYRA